MKVLTFSLLYCDVITKEFESLVLWHYNMLFYRIMTPCFTAFKEIIQDILQFR